jgi:hypothetical protein
LPAAAAAKKPRTSPIKTLQKNKPLKDAECAQQTHVSVNAFRALEYIGCEDGVPILCDSINIDNYNCCSVYFSAHIIIVVRNLQLKERDAIFTKTISEFAADYEQ